MKGDCERGEASFDQGGSCRLSVVCSSFLVTHLGVSIEDETVAVAVAVAVTRAVVIVGHRRRRRGSVRRMGQSARSLLVEVIDEVREGVFHLFRQQIAVLLEGSVSRSGFSGSAKRERTRRNRDGR